jgi:hypothetical protein
MGYWCLSWNWLASSCPTFQPKSSQPTALMYTWSLFLFCFDPCSINLSPKLFWSPRPWNPRHYFNFIHCDCNSRKVMVPLLFLTLWLPLLIGPGMFYWWLGVLTRIGHNSDRNI